MKLDTSPIAAIATAPGRGGIGVVRASGKSLGPLIETLFPQAKLTPRHATYIPFTSTDGTVIDQGLALYFRAPHSYTGEDVLELQGHGGPVVLQMLLARVLEAGREHGLRLAEPGEFTRRAYLNDKLDLAQAEAVADLIDASTEAAAKSASQSLSGAFSQVVHRLVEQTINLRMLVEATLDFPEEEIDFLEKSNARGQLATIIDSLEHVFRQAAQGALLREGLNVVLVGQPNVGKSSLLNALAGAEVAIVTPIAGTTRDKVSETIQIEGTVSQDYFDNQTDVDDVVPVLTGESDFILTNTEFTFENFARLFDSRDFWAVIWATLFYTIFGTIGALLVGLFAALLLNHSFRGQGILRGFYLFPYVAPVIAVAFSWVILFDPFSGSVNALLVQMGVTESSINFFGERPLALIMVTVFEIWRYFPLSFLFILARMQSIDTDMYEAADMDGASPFQKFRYLSLPQLMGILSVLFLLRFIWTFNKFDDIFLLTGGNAGTRTLTVNVYEQAFELSNIGAGAAVAVVILLCLLAFSWGFFRFISREEGL